MFNYLKYLLAFKALSQYEESSCPCKCRQLTSVGQAYQPLRLSRKATINASKKIYVKKQTLQFFSEFLKVTVNLLVACQAWNLWC